MDKTPGSKSGFKLPAKVIGMNELKSTSSPKAATITPSNVQADVEAVDDTSTSLEIKATEQSLSPTPVSTTSSDIQAASLSSAPSTESKAPSSKPTLDRKPLKNAMPDSSSAPPTPIYITLEACDDDDLITPTFPPNALNGTTPSLFTTIDPKPTSVAWYKSSLSPIPAAFRELLEEYSSIPSSEVEGHVKNVRDTLWQTHPYPCLGLGYFLRLDLSLHTLYLTILSHLRTHPSAALLDLGCGLGQDLRKCAFDLSSTTPGSNPRDLLMGGKFFGIDVSTLMVEAGGWLFRDNFPSKVWVGDLMEEGGVEDVLAAWEGKAPSMAFVGKVFHLFGWADQVKLAAGVVKLLVAGLGVKEVLNSEKGGAGEHADNRGENMEWPAERKWWNKAYEEGFRKGYEAGCRKGYEAAMYEEGFKDGFTKGYEKEYGRPPSSTTATAASALHASDDDNNTTLRATTFNPLEKQQHHRGHHNHPPLIIFGDSLGVERDEDAGLQSVGFKSSNTAFIHSPGTLRKFWAEVGEATGTRWEVLNVAFENVGPAGFNDDGSWGREEGRLMKWGVRFEGRV